MIYLKVFLYNSSITILSIYRYLIFIVNEHLNERNHKLVLKEEITDLQMGITHLLSVQLNLKSNFKLFQELYVLWDILIGEPRILEVHLLYCAQGNFSSLHRLT